jgi:Zinc binding domain
MKTIDCCSNTAPAVEMTINVAEALAANPENAPAPQDDPRRGCRSCGGASRPVTRKTVLLMLWPELIDRVDEAEYRFCSDTDCRVVYFTENSDQIFTTDDLRVRVGLKEKEGEIPLCYCFGFDEADARKEIMSMGHCSIPQRIAALIKQGMCACPAKNPSGSCCLGEVYKAIKRLTLEVVETVR